ncbi:MAG: hypothetical protein FWF30_03170, partial [Coriobacteriia bacterium]|nr:hypothetical protein [Coriobacteriia bacterium]
MFLIAFAQAASAGVVISAPNGLEGTGVVDASDEPALLPSQNEPATTTGVKPLNITGVLYGEPVVTPATGWEVQHVVLGDFGYDVLTITASGSYQIRMTSPGAVGIGWSLVVAKGVTAEITLDGASFW